MFKARSAHPAEPQTKMALGYFRHLENTSFPNLIITFPLFYIKYGNVVRLDTLLLHSFSCMQTQFNLKHQKGLNNNIYKIILYLILYKIKHHMCVFFYLFIYIHIYV